MKNAQTLAGKIISIKANDTRYGRRAEAKIETIDFSTGEVTETTVLAWKEAAVALEDEGLGKDVGMSGFWVKDDQPSDRKFRANAVSNLRIIDPATFDASKYL